MRRNRRPKTLILKQGYEDRPSDHEVADAFSADRQMGWGNEVFVHETTLYTVHDLERLIRWLKRAQDWLDART